jgi:hypothetical protein
MVYSSFVTSIWYTPVAERSSANPSRFCLRTLPYRFISTIALSDDSNLDGIILPQWEDLILEYSIIDTDNVENFSIDRLPRNIRADLIDKIVELYYPTDDFYKILLLNIELMLNSRFSNENYNCTKCQERKLHYQKNCPYLPKEEHDPTFRLPFMGEIISECPMPKKDPTLCNRIMDAYKIQDLGHLPEKGGIGDQPIFFILAASRFQNKLDEIKRKQEEEAQKKRSQR